jgi:hypothetical protein
MKKIVILLLIMCITGLSLSAQKVINKQLKQKLDSIYVLDQKYREATTKLNSGGNPDFIATSFHTTTIGLYLFLVNEMQRVDSLNLESIKHIFKQYGYPGKSLVGSPTNEVGWNVIQHSSHIEQYIDIIKKAANENEIPYPLYCKMLDRLLMEKGEEQIYGTQIAGLTVVDKMTGDNKWKMFVWPVRNASEINKTRKKIGLKQSIEDYAKTFGVIYQPMTLSDVQNLKKPQ